MVRAIRALADKIFDQFLKELSKEEKDDKNYNELRAKMSPAARERSRAMTEEYIAQMALDELREAQKMTQEHLAKLLGVNQSAISKMERRTDMYISTLQSIIEAMGGRLQIQAIFPVGKVEINQFSNHE